MGDRNVRRLKKFLNAFLIRRRFDDLRLFFEKAKTTSPDASARPPRLSEMTQVVKRKEQSPAREIQRGFVCCEDW